MQICAIPNTQYPWWGCINIISNFVKGNSLLNISWKFLRKPVYLQSFLPIVVFLLISKSQGEIITRLNLAISKLSISSSLDIFKTCQQMIINKWLFKSIEHLLVQSFKRTKIFTTEKSALHIFSLLTFWRLPLSQVSDCQESGKLTQSDSPRTTGRSLRLDFTVSVIHWNLTFSCPSSSIPSS